ncbi:MAG: sulfite exporter TauE/SafE family protein [Alphaproteobacteria bacterium]|nr:sulfite exporter TauE/SafE family protein [Alphaproteobacteria bacterium]
MQIYLPIAEMAVPVESILLLGTVVGFLSGVFGVGGGFLMTPFLIFMGLPPGIAVGTQANQLVAASLSGVLGHFKRGNVDFKLGGVMLAGSIVGSVIGVVLFRMLQYIGQIDFVIPILYVVLLGSMGTLMFFESLMVLIRSKGKPTASDEKPSLHHHPFFQALPYKMRFPRSRLYVSALLPAGIGFVGGLLVSIMGIGGGFLLVPAMIYLLGMPTLLVAGTSLFQILITTVVTTILHATTSHSVDLVLASMLIISGVVGVQIGVRASRRITGAWARVALAALLLFVSIQLAGQLFIRPLDLYSAVVW